MTWKVLGRKSLLSCLVNSVEKLKKIVKGERAQPRFESVSSRPFKPCQSALYCEVSSERIYVKSDIQPFAGISLRKHVSPAFVFLVRRWDDKLVAIKAC
jgi:hypothetical protein